MLLVSFGGPEGPDDVMPFLRNVVRGRGVPDERLLAVAEHYQHFGGVSPINEQCRSLLAQLRTAFADAGLAVALYWGNRNWDPFLADTVARMREDGVRRALAFVTSPYGSYSSCRQYLDDIEAARDQLGDTLWPGYARSAGTKDFFHYMAFDGGRPVAIAALCIFEDLGYLMAAATAESHRKRGAQQALIAKRIERAEQLGCSIQVSETLYMLEHSYRNLQRAGFQEVYEKEVYEWSA